MNDFEYFNKQDIDEHVTIFTDKIKNDFYNGEGPEGLKQYKVCLQDNWFLCSYDDEELQSLIRNSILLIERLKKNIDNGYALLELQADYQAKAKEWVSEDCSTRDIVATCHCASKILETADTDEVMTALYTTARVGGAYLMLVAGPMFKSAIYGVYEILCKYKEGKEKLMNEPEIFSIYFLVRAAMKMHSDSD